MTKEQFLEFLEKPNKEILSSLKVKHSKYVGEAKGALKKAFLKTDKIFNKLKENK